jgi:hypothetical protein
VSDDVLRGDYSRAGSLKEAVEVCRRSLAADGGEDYARLVTEERVRSAIRAALESCRHALEKRAMPYGEDYPQARDGEVEKEIRHFEEVVKPVYLGIADGGSWPRGASFFHFLSRTDDRGVRYECLGLRLEIETPGATFRGFALPVIDLYYGRFAYAEDEG